MACCVYNYRDERKLRSLKEKKKELREDNAGSTVTIDCYLKKQQHLFDEDKFLKTPSHESFISKYDQMVKLYPMFNTLVLLQSCNPAQVSWNPTSVIEVFHEVLISQLFRCRCRFGCGFLV